MTLPDVPVAFYHGPRDPAHGHQQGGFAAGAGGLSVPLMSLVVAPPVAAGIMLPILCAMDLFGVHAYRGRWFTKHLAALVPGALIGIVR